VYDPVQIGRNPNFVCILSARKVDLTGRIALPSGKGNMAGPGDVADFLDGAQLSPGGLTIFGLPSRNREGESNIRLSIEDIPNQFVVRESLDMIATEYGVARLKGRTIRERAQALIEIAHPDDRLRLIQEAKAHKILYADQIFLPESARLYPSQISAKAKFGKDTEIRFRAIKPSDEEEMRRLFYRFSDQAVYYRYFSPVKTMPHAKMQAYVNIDYERTLSIVGLIDDGIVAEARFSRWQDSTDADIAFVVDERHQGLGVATYLYKMLVRLARERGVRRFTAQVLASNKPMMKVFEKGGVPIKAKLDSGVYELVIDLSD
jgi:RimJ/RimL family protein N-acetyltransferase